MSAHPDASLQRLRTVGVRAASVIDLIAVGFSRHSSDVALSEVAGRKMLIQFRSIRGLVEASLSEISASTGLEEFETLRAQALMELGRRAATAGKGPITQIDSPDDAAELLDYLRYEKKEHVVAILLDAKNAVIRIAEIHVGTLSSSIVGAREIFREAIREGASSLVLVHNHPSGDPEPSPEDIRLTGELRSIGNMLDIPLRDHVIIGERKHVSLARRGYCG